MGLEKVIELAKDHVPTTGDLSALGVDRLRAMISALDQALPLVTDAGYSLENMFVELGLPPRVVVRAKRVRSITEAEQEALRERAKDHSVASAVVQSFLMAASLQDTLSVGSLRVTDVEIEATTVPRVRLYFTHEPVALDATGSLSALPA